MNRETRRFHQANVRAVQADDGTRYVTLQAVTPYVVDDYGSVWLPDVFDAALEERMPTLAWGHSWVDPIGRGVSYERTGQNGPSIRFRMDNGDDVPRARQAWAQLQPGPNGEPATIDDCSVGFSNTQRRDPTDDEKTKWPGVKEIIEKADLDEVSLVLRGAVPGAKVLQLRSKGATVDSEFVIDLALRVDKGEITREQAQTAIDLAARTDNESVGGPGPEVPTPAAGVTDTEEAEAAADEALEALERSAR